jgi:hypothetical protein
MLRFFGVLASLRLYYFLFSSVFQYFKKKSLKPLLELISIFILGDRVYDKLHLML